MIKSCEDITTTDEFDIFYNIYHNTHNIGLEETADIMCWDETYVVNPISRFIDD